MSIRNASIALGATFAPTGGSATSIVLINQDASNAKAFVASSGVTPLTRTELAFSSSLSRPNSAAPGGFTQGRASVKVTVPKILANAARTLNSAQVSFSLDPETTAADLTSLKSVLINLINDSDFDQLWLNQSLD